MNKKVPSGIGPRVALFLRATYQRNRAKQIARQFNVSVSNAQRWLDGTAPTTAHLEAMLALWGMDFVRAIFIEACDAADGRIVQIAQLVEARLDLMRELQHQGDLFEAARHAERAGISMNHDWSPGITLSPCPPPMDYAPPSMSDLIDSLAREI